MDFDLSEDQKMLQKTVRDFVKQESTVERFRKLRDAEEGNGWQKETWKKMGELGWLAIPFPEEVGGFGGSFVDAALVLEQLGVGLVPEPYLASVCMAGMALLHGGSSEQHTQYLSPMLEGDTSLALAALERDGRFNMTRPQTQAQKTDDGYALFGQKTFVLNGHAADSLVISARADDGFALFVVDANAEGIERQTIRLMDGHRAANILLSDVKVSEAQRLKATPAEEVLAKVMNYAAAAAVSEGLGVSQAMLQTTVEYLKTREQFGKKIGSFQALQHRAVEMFVEVELLKSISAEASMRVAADGDDQVGGAVSAAKYQLATGATFASRAAIQLHGGIGVTDEADIGLFFKRLHVLTTVGGDERYHLGRYPQ